MKLKKYILLYLLFVSVIAFSQVNTGKQFTIKGTVKTKENRNPISGVEVSATSGAIVYTDAFGAYRIKAEVGDYLLFKSLEFETVEYRIKDDEDVDVLVEGLDEDVQLSKSALHKMYLDSAKQFKKIDIGKSIDYIRVSLEQLGKRGNNKERAASYALLGEIYQYHKQYDLAVDNYKESLTYSTTGESQLLLANAYLLNKEYKKAEVLFLKIDGSAKLSTYKKIVLYEGLGDAYKGLKNTSRAVANYTKGLDLAKKELVKPKITDLNTKIAEAYGDANQTEEAVGYFKNSLKSAKTEAPQRALEVNDRAADFYNKNSLYNEEMKLRQQSLEDIELLENSSKKKAVKRNAVTKEVEAPITRQRINYKIANNLIVQDKLDEAIPYLEESISEAASEDDLVVQKDATRKLSEVYDDKGDYSKALETYKKYAAVADTLYARKEQEISRAERLSKQIAEKQNRITGLEKDKELYESKSSLAQTKQDLYTTTSIKQKILIYALVLGMFLFGIAAFFFYRSNRQQKLANNLLALKSLRSQMNPHFIFNALNSVNNYISKSDERSANRFLSEFSTLMRAVLENSEEDFIPLTKELELLELYVKLEHSRFSDKFNYTITTDPNIDVAAFQIPPMLLQPYIENAIWHGLRYKDELGFLNINLKQKNKETIEITIEDNGIGRKKSAELKTQNQKKQRSKGMGNIKKRVAILNSMYKDKVDVSIKDLSSDGSGTKVLLTLKKD
ncbi:MULTISPECIES: histidine kinase [unclassified Cellulophaga]|uniref:histidine kinase n=1 Tax=unclassified Cellulophaga TaxID=2634405 RepID=UPI0026E3577B|nr:MULTISPECIES: histidine kinase [unclassified Cellulophaga]MDO6490310.1 histidine kinase [Cellulophaga sp. 2_MG-2023]MDO6494496.1 histidine kinase [Cellulophaga sp. 3_MG-2023]